MINQRTERSKTGVKISKECGRKARKASVGRMEPGGRNFKIPSPPLAIFCVSLGPFLPAARDLLPAAKNLRAPLKFCPCAVCVSCDRAALDRAKSLSLEFCSKFIAKFKIISLKLAPSPREIGYAPFFAAQISDHTIHPAVLAAP